MKYCVRCGNEMKDDASFCPACGQNQDKEVSTENKASVMENETVQQTISAGKNYFSYFWAKFISPTFVIEQAMTYFGYVTLLLFTLFQSLIIFAEIKRAGRQFGSMMSFLVPSLSSTFDIGFAEYLKIFIYFLLFVVVSVGITFVVIHFILKVQVNIHDIINKFASVFSAVTMLSLLIAFCALIDLTSMSVSIIVLLAGFFVSFIAIILLVSEKENYVASKWSPFYGVSLTVVIIALIDMVIINLFQ